MTVKNLKLVAETSSIGTSIFLRSADKKYNECVAEFLEENPLAKSDDNLNAGYLFRSPNISQHDWEKMLKTLYSIEDSFSITAVLEREKGSSDTVIGFARFSSQSDASIFAWSNLEQWQKWDDSKESEYQETKKNSSKKISVDKDGNIKVKVTVSTLSDQ